MVVAEYLQKHLAPLLAPQQPTEVVAGYQRENPIMAPALPLTFQCVPAGTFKSGVTERCVQLAMNVAAGCGFQSEALELMMRRLGGK